MSMIMGSLKHIVKIVQKQFQLNLRTSEDRVFSHAGTQAVDLNHIVFYYITQYQQKSLAFLFIYLTSLYKCLPFY